MSPSVIPRLHSLRHTHDDEFLQKYFPEIHQKMQTLIAIGIHPECLESFYEFRSRITRTLCQQNNHTPSFNIL